MRPKVSVFTRLAGALLGALLAVKLQAAARPNIVFIFSDDHAVKAVSAYDDNLVSTPNIDRLAKAGVRFNRAYVGNAICGPSRATTLTGTHSHANGFVSNEWSGEFDGSQQTFPKLLQAAGYQTAVVGKWHLYSDPTGFDHWDVIDNAFEQGTYFNPRFRSSAGEEETNGYVAELITDKAIQWLDAGRELEQPFLLMVHHKTPHRNWTPGPEELRHWDEDARLPEPPSLLRDLSHTSIPRQNARMSIGEHMGDNDVKLSMPGNLDEQQAALWQQAFGPGNMAYAAQTLSQDEQTRWKYQRYLKTYLASIRGMDRQIGRLLDHLDANGLADNTLIVYTSDQGFFLGENGWFDKRWMDEISARVPLLMQWSGTIPAGISSNDLVQNIDYAPTLLAAAGVEPATPMHGVNLLPRLSGERTAPWQRDLYYHYYENPGFHGVARHYGIRAQRYKLIHFYRDEVWELYDLQTDPEDQVNLYGKPGFEAITADLKKRLQSLRAQYQVPEQDPEAPWYHGPMIRLFEWLLNLR